MHLQKKYKNIGLCALFTLLLPVAAEASEKLSPKSRIDQALQGLEETPKPGQAPEQPKTPPFLPNPIQIAPETTDETKTADPDYVYSLFQRGWYLTAFGLATALAEQGNSSAQTLVGVMHETGLGIRQDKKKAAEWYQLAVNAGDTRAALQLAQFYLLGTGVAEDKKKAADLFELAAKKDIPTAIYNLALLYEEGAGRSRDEQKARELLKRAAQLNDTEAQYTLALSYLEGIGGQGTDERQGAFWMGRAARRGHTAAQVYYGILRFQGKGLEINEKEAADWFERAARSGNPVAMNRLARTYAAGRGRKQDAVLAAAWHLVARAAGIPDLKLDSYVSGLDDENRALAQKKAQEFYPTLLPPSASEVPNSP